MYSYGPPHMAEQKQDDKLEHTYSSYVRIRDVALKTCQRWWTIGKSGERGSVIFVLAARHDDDDDYLLNPTKMCLPLNSPWMLIYYYNIEINPMSLSFLFYTTIQTWLSGKISSLVLSYAGLDPSLECVRVYPYWKVVIQGNSLWMAIYIYIYIYIYAAYSPTHMYRYTHLHRNTQTHIRYVYTHTFLWRKKRKSLHKNEIKTKYYSCIGYLFFGLSTFPLNFFTSCQIC